MKEKHYITRKEQAVLTKKKIFDTTIFLIRKKGYSKITIREICQNAEISVGTFYLYFLSKDDILLDLYSKVNQKLQDSAAIQNNDTPEKMLLFLVKAFWEQLEVSFEKELLSEIYRITLSQKKDMLLSEGQPFFQLLWEASGLFLKEKSIAGTAGPDQLAKSIAVKIQGYLFHWLVTEDISFSETREECLEDLRQFLTNLYDDFHRFFHCLGRDIFKYAEAILFPGEDIRTRETVKGNDSPICSSPHGNQLWRNSGHRNGSFRGFQNFRMVVNFSLHIQIVIINLYFKSTCAIVKIHIGPH